jgi:hypothetical protein
VAFAGVMAFIFSDLVVLPVLRINARYYGWKMALYILLMLFSCLVVTSLLLHYGLHWLDLLPDPQAWSSPAERDHFQLNYQFWLNLIFALISAALIWLRHSQKSHGHHHHQHGSKAPVINSFVLLSILWLVPGVLLALR